MPENASFRELISRVRKQDEQAAREVVRQYEGAIRRVVRIQLRDARMRRVFDSMDVCQSVLASFFVRTALGEFELDSPKQLMGLLATIARNKLTNQALRMTAQRRDVRRVSQGIDDAAAAVDQASDPSEQASARELLGEVRRRLSEEERSIAELRSHGLAWKEIAAEIGGNEVSLRKKLSRALSRVMSEMGLGEEPNE